MAKKRVTAYTKNRNRILAYNRKLRKQGLDIGLYIPTERELRQSGVKGRELASLTRTLKSLTPKELRKRAVEVKVETQPEEFVPPTNVSEDTTMYDEITISNFRAHVRQFNEKVQVIIFDWLNKLLSTQDKHDVAVMLNDGADNGNILTYQIVYSQDALTEYLSDMLDYLPEVGSLFKEQMMEAVEELESYDPIL